MHRTICDFLLDIIQNSIEAGSSTVLVSVQQDESRCEMTVADDGCGMDAAELQAARDPFYTKEGKHSRRHVGLGIPFLAQADSMTDGIFDIQSEKGFGTSVRWVLPMDHMDTPPLGDLPGTFLSAFTYPGDFELTVLRSAALGGKEESYELVRSELSEALGDLVSVGSLSLLQAFITSQEQAVQELLNG